MFNQNNVQVDSSTNEYVRERFMGHSMSIQPLTIGLILKRLTLVVLIISLIIGFFYYVNGQLIKQSEVLTEDPGRYGSFREYVNVHGLKVFPSYNKGESISYLFYKHQSMFDNTFQVSFACQYDLKTFQEELNRIEALYVKQDDGGIGRPKYVDDLFEIPAYVLVFNDNRTYEYVLIDEVHRRMVYVYLKYYDQENIKIHSDYLPKVFDALEPMNVYLGIG